MCRFPFFLSMKSVPYCGKCMDPGCCACTQLPTGHTSLVLLKVSPFYRGRRAPQSLNEHLRQQQR